MCLLSGFGEPDVVHIMPPPLIKESTFCEDVWGFFEAIWGAEQTALWKGICHDTDTINLPSNTLCLSRHFHNFWGTAQFGLKPLRVAETAENNEVWLQFHWLSQGRLDADREFYPDDDNTDYIDYERTSVVLNNLERHGLGNLFVEEGPECDCDDCYDDSSDECSDFGDDMDKDEPLRPQIKTGQIFVVKADNTSLLPSLDLLELRWAFSLMAALSNMKGYEENVFLIR